MCFTTMKERKESIMTQTFDKERFKQQVTFKVKALCRRTIEEATPQQIFQAVCFTIKEEIVDKSEAKRS